MATATDDDPWPVNLAPDALHPSVVESTAARLSAAIREFTASGDRRRAALACAQLGNVFANAMGNQTAGRAWFLRATRLLEGEPPCVEQGWVAVAALGCDVDDPAELHACAELALDRARQFGEIGRAHV